MSRCSLATEQDRARAAPDPPTQQHRQPQEERGPQDLPRESRPECQRHIFFVVFLFLHVLVATLGFLHYFLKDNLVGARAEYGITFVLARAAALVLNVDVIFILLPVCHNFISVMCRTPAGMVIPFDKNLTLHKAMAWAIFLGSWVHTIAHIFNLYHLAMNDTSATTTGQRVVFFIVANFLIGPLITGRIVLIILCVRVYYPDRPPYCSFNTIGVLRRYWIVGGIIWIYERILPSVRSCHVYSCHVYISKVVQHPSGVMEVQIKKEKTSTRAGYTPSCSRAPPEDTFRSTSLSRDEKGAAGGKVIGTNTNPPLNRTLPRVVVDGPFGTSSEEFLNYETVLLVGAGIGVTPFASILKNIWYRMNNFNTSKPTRLSKVYFTWVIRDSGTAEWFHSLLHAIEEQDTQNRIEINIYLTAKIKEDDMNNIFVQDVGAEKDSITSPCANAFRSPELGQDLLVDC
ncbi:putative NADPH oxidase [Mycena chlorophos]|uniref:Putative NADPH oxidase n=1 Tax=Mycena chlorophos TaxID=658473 RepID=A0A8H6TAT9_MYCCL|nr:putative NADPH oxidase [Mycena chlorophos]